MHEASVVSSLLDLVDYELNNRNITGKVVKIVVTVGVLSCVNPDALAFSFEILSAGTISEDAELVIERVMANCYCIDCETVSEIEDAFCSCPVCGSNAVTVTGAGELELSSMEIEGF